MKQEIFALSSEFISELLTGMRLRGVQYRRVQTGPSFGFDLPECPGHAYFYYLAVGFAWLRHADGSRLLLNAGDAVLLPHGGAHQLVSDAESACHPLEGFEATRLSDAVGGVDTCPSTHAVPSAILFHGRMEFDLGGMQGLAPLMPGHMRIDTSADTHAGLVPILDAMKREICSGRIGFAGILARLAEVAAAMTVRSWIECGCDNAPGLVAALRDPRLARSILALHRDPGRDWTVEALAMEGGVSRSVFAERFQATIGMPPLRYATELRMRLAGRWLGEERESIDSVAYRLGYSSQAAFSRAFKRVTGASPGSSRAAR
jgi:AraC-like DNA-binding protein